MLSGDNAKRHTGEPSSRSHIDKGELLDGKKRNQGQRIKDVERQGILKISDAREIDIAVDLINIQQMLDASCHLSTGHLDPNPLGQVIQTRAEGLHAVR